jgi:hypothetical protein
MDNWWRKMANLSKGKTNQEKGISDSILSKFWLKEQFDQIDKSNALILQRIEELNKQNVLVLAGIKDIKEALDKTNQNVSPELEFAVKQVFVSAAKVDEKVPDK